jgi:hypothetical protein
MVAAKPVGFRGVIVRVEHRPDRQQLDWILSDRMDRIQPTDRGPLPVQATWPAISAMQRRAGALRLPN